MRVGELARLRCAPEFAYGETGALVRVRVEGEGEREG
jgi:FKBP-type peptidyl-prolyl cis-trans isomerase